MKALVKFARGKDGLALKEVPMPVPKPGELLVKVAAAGICATDIYAMKDKREMEMPVILGHEFVGEVSQTCGDVGDFKVGDWIVTLPACYSCGECEFCKQGMVTLCDERKSIGSHRNGAMADYVAVPAKYSFKVPDDINDKIAYAAIEPLACSGRGIFERIEVKSGDLVLLSGPGTIGLGAIQFLKLRGAYVIVSGLPSDKHRFDLALSLGADEYVDNVADLRKAIAAKGKEGVDIAVEAAGVAASLDTCLAVLKKHGTLLELGAFPTRVEFNYPEIFNKELYLTASNSSAMSSWDLTLRLLAEGKLNLEKLISLKVPLSEWKYGFEAVQGKSAAKVILIP